MTENSIYMRVELECRPSRSIFWSLTRMIWDFSALPISAPYIRLIFWLPPRIVGHGFGLNIIDIGLIKLLLYVDFGKYLI